MFREAGYDPVVQPASVIEELPYEMNPTEAVMYLAKLKAKAVADLRPSSSEETIIGADTVVVYENRILGKPKDKNEAYANLMALRGTSHRVITGCCVIKNGDAQCFYEETKVFFKNYSEEELLEYVNTDEPYDKAGGYAIQGTFGKYIDHFEGDYDNVVGLPFTKLKTYL